MPGTNVWGPLFVIAGLIFLVVVIKVLIGIWTRYATLVEKTQKMAQDTPQVLFPTPSWVPPTISTILIVGGFIVICTLGWNAVMGITSNVSTYENPAEVELNKKIRQSKPPTKQEVDAAKEELKQRADEQPHQAAISSFDKAMEAEAAKIRQRSMKTTPEATETK
jgi:uncharacterized iron-regulated membrane protein